MGVRAQLRDAATLAEIGPPLGVVISAAFSPDGSRLVTGSPDGSARLIVGGLPDPAGVEGLPGDPRHTPDVDAVFEGAPDGTRLLLAHQPAAAVAAVNSNAALTLSGHTHGGQIFPWSLLVGLQQPIISGLRRRAGRPDWIYVSRGVGYWGPPMRLGAPSEITCLTLRSD